jgi:cytoskeletal protein CcmA (bactofilin family)
MLGTSKGKRKQSGITLIANNCEIVGDVHFSDQLQVNGMVKGNIISEEGTNAMVSVSEKGRVNGEIRVPTVVINGTVHGDIYCRKHIELAAKSRVNGNVYYCDIEMVMGSRVDGKLIHVSESEQAMSKPGPEPRKVEPSVKKVSDMLESMSQETS